MSSSHFRKLRQSQSFNPEAVQSYLAFLDRVDVFPCLYFHHGILRNTIRRYETLWIPLLAGVAKAERASLLPPLDVEWAWVCHTRSPWRYCDDMQLLLEPGVISDTPIDRSFGIQFIVDADDREAGYAKAEVLWNEKYGDEPFDICEDLSFCPVIDDDEESVGRNVRV